LYLLLHGGSSLRSSTDRPEGSQRERTGREDRRLNFYGLRDNLRSECLDWLLIVNRRHLERVLRVFVHHYNSHRPHRSLKLLPPDPESPTLRLATSLRPDHVERRDRPGGLIHEYGFAA